MKRVLLLIAFVAVSATTFASANSYRINDDVVEAAFDQSIKQVSFMEAAAEVSPEGLVVMDGEAVLSQPEPIIAALLAFPYWGLGALGIHRLYLQAGVKVMLIYWITCGGIFGIIPFVDFIVLIIGVADDDISKFVGNTKFIMW